MSIKNVFWKLKLESLTQQFQTITEHNINISVKYNINLIQFFHKFFLEIKKKTFPGVYIFFRSV